MATLSPPPPDGSAVSWARWVLQLWNTLRGESNLDDTLGTVANTTGTQTLTNKTLTNLKDNTRAYARATQSAAQSIAHGATTVVSFNSTDIDTRAGVSGSGTTGWKYTVPTGHGGIYLVTSSISVTGNGASVGFAFAQLWKNGAAFALMGFDKAPANNVSDILGGSTIVSLVAGDYIDLRCGQVQDAGTAARTLNNSAIDNYISIVRLVTDL